MNALIDRYIHQVREHLPQRLRDDVARELESLILDTLEHRAAGGPITDALVVDVLRVFGEPSEVAARYTPERDTPIRSAWLPAFWWSLARLPIAVAILFLGFFLLAALARPLAWSELLRPSYIAEWVWAYAVGLAIMTGVLVIVFVVLSRFRFAEPPRPARFDPRALSPVPAGDVDTASRGAAAVAVIALVVLLTLLNVVPEWFGVLTSASGEDGFRFRMLPFGDLGLHVPFGALTVWASAALALAVALVVLGRWTRWLRLYAVAVGLSCAVLLGYIVVTNDAASAPPQLYVVGRMAVAVIAGNALLVLAWCGYRLMSILRPDTRALRTHLA